MATSLQQGWAVRTAAGPPGTAAHWQWGGSRSRVHGRGGANGPSYVKFGKRRDPTPSVSFKKKIQNSIDDQKFEGSVALHSFICCCPTHPMLIKDTYSAAAAGCLFGITDQVGNEVKLQTHTV